MHLRKFFALAFVLYAVLSNEVFSRSLSYDDQDCLVCHGKPEIYQVTKEGTVRSLYVNPEEWSQDIHHQGKITCIDCHREANPYFHFREGFEDVDCASCHPEEEEEYQKNIHLTFSVVTPGKELPLCYHCHTKHYVLPHDDSTSSVHSSNIGDTCGECHPEVMVESLLNGTSLGKISGHRKGDLSEPFDMKVCIDCHYEDSAHGAKRVYKDFCTRCHDVRSKGNPVMGPTHLNSTRWAGLNYAGNVLFFGFLISAGLFMMYRLRKGIGNRLKTWVQSMEKEENQDTEKNTKKDME